MTNPETASAGKETGQRVTPQTRPAPSPRRRLVLALAVAAFLLWLGYLAFLALTTRHPEVLSRPQFLVSNLSVIATLTGGADHPDAMVAIEQVIWSGDSVTVKANDKITVKDLDSINSARGWDGPGKYILALTQRDGTLGVTPIPPSPGYPANAEQQANRLRIYRAKANALEQLADIEQQYHRP